MPRVKNAHGQYFTPAPVARLMTTLLTTSPSLSVLEPCSGQGVFLDALVDAGYTDVTAREIDPALVAQSHHPVSLGSFVSWRPERSFDAVIGNPPYIRWRDLDEPSREEVIAHPLYKDLFNSLSDYLTVFIAASVQLLNPGGELIFITPSFWMHTAHSSALREWLLDHGAITDVIDFQEAAVFPGVASAIVIFRFEKGATPGPVSYARYCGLRKVEGALDLADPTQFTRSQLAPFVKDAHWSLATREELAPALALENACTKNDVMTRIGDVVTIANGMVSGLDKAFRVSPSLYVTLNDDERDCLFEVVKASHLTPYYTPTITHYMNIPEGLDERAVRVTYPHLLAQLDTHREALDARYSYQRDLPFYEWAFKRSEAFFTSPCPKGFVPCKERLTARSEARFTLATPHALATQDVTAFATLEATKESLAYIVAYLNQPAVTRWLRVRGLMKGGVAEFSERPLANIPFRSIDFDNAIEAATHEHVTMLMHDLAALGADRDFIIAQIRALFDVLLGLGEDAPNR